MEPVFKHFAWLCRLIAALLCGAGISTEASPAQFEEANKLYEQGKFADAAKAYEAILSQGEASAPLYFNLGNAWFKAGQTGKAILSYRRAEQMAPRDPDIQANLRFVRETVLGPKPKSTAWSRLQKSLSASELALFVTAASWLWFGLLIAATLRPSLRDRLRLAARVSGALTVALSLWMIAQARETSGRQWAVVTRNEAPVRFGPLEESQTAFTLKDGSEIKVLSRKEGWLEIEDASRRKGWLPAGAALPVAKLDSSNAVPSAR